MKTLAINRRASFDYTFLETYEAGLVLSGQEAKSAKLGHVSLKGSFITFRGSVPHLTNAHITPYAFAGKLTGYDPTQPRRLLLKKKEIARLIGKVKTEGLTAVATKLIQRRGLVKLEFALARGKKQYDKRKTLEQRQTKRKIDRAMRGKLDR